MPAGKMLDVTGNFHCRWSAADDSDPDGPLPAEFKEPSPGREQL
jgi:hypothetical protein